MSLINDALKRAQESQKKTPSGVAPLRPVESGSRGIGWILPASVILLLAVAGIFIALALHKNKTPAPVVARPPEVSAPQPAAIAPAPEQNISAPQPAAIAPIAPATESNAPAAVIAETNAPAVPAAPDWPKVQGIIFDANRPVAIVNGKMVSVGDRAGDFQVTEIAKNFVTFEAADGSKKTLGIGQ
jgi:hypothetical protein